MPRTHERTFRVRHYECDIFGYVYPADYLRYMQETAFDATAAAGYPVNRYETMGRLWLVRESDVEHLRPLRYGDSVTVRTWVADFRRVRSRRAYELRLADSGELVARAQTDWVFLETATGRPASIPSEMMEAFFPEGAPQMRGSRDRFPPAPPPPDGFYRQRRRVEWRDQDQAQHVNNSMYLVYLEDCGMQAVAACGWPPDRMQSEGFAITSARHRIEYLEPAVLGDDLELSTWISDVTPTSALRHHCIVRLRDGTVITRARSSWGVLDLVTEERIPIPPALLNDLEPSVSCPASSEQSGGIGYSSAGRSE